MSKQLFDIDTFRAQPLPSEEEVMANWQGDIEEPVVSVLCNTFNQKIYIEDAFRGFLIQKTDFPFEVIVHDDASTDGTSDIVREYAERYPKIFKPVIQTENQYSQGKKIISLSASYSKGRYIAICEGDDFWIENVKLQKQYDSMVKKPEANICFTKGLGLKGDYTTEIISDNGFQEKMINASAVILGGGFFMPTASLFIKSKILKNMPEWFKNAPVGDYYIQVIAAMEGGALYLPIKSCCYRMNAVGSWTNKNKNININSLIELRIKHDKCCQHLMDEHESQRFILKLHLIKTKTKLLLGFVKRLELYNFYHFSYYFLTGKNS